MTTKHSFRAEPVRALVRLIVAGVAVLAVALFGSVPASAAAGTSQAQAQAGSYSSGPQAVARTGGASTVSSVAVAGSRAGRSWRTYTVGVYPWVHCNYLGVYYQTYYAARGYRANFQCLYWGGVPPLHRGLLRVSVLV